MDANMKVVKGINIAIIVLAILGTIASLFSIVALGMIGAVLQDPSVQMLMQQDYYGNNYYYGGGIDPETAVLLTFVTSGVAVAGVALNFIAAIVSLIAGILGLRSVTQPQQLKSAFVMSIVAIVCNVISFSLILLVLFVISAVYLNKARKNVPVCTVNQPAGQPNAYVRPSSPSFSQGTQSGCQPPTQQGTYQQQGRQNAYQQPNSQQQYGQTFSGHVPPVQPGQPSPAPFAKPFDYGQPSSHSTSDAGAVPQPPVPPTTAPETTSQSTVSQSTEKESIDASAPQPSPWVESSAWSEEAFEEGHVADKGGESDKPHQGDRQGGAEKEARKETGQDAEGEQAKPE